MNTLLTIFTVIFGILAVVCSVLTYISARYARNAAEWIRLNNKRSRVLKQMTVIETELTEHTDSIVTLQAMLHKLRSRIGMRELAARRKVGESEIPDSKTDPEAWKAYMRAQLQIPLKERNSGT